MTPATAQTCRQERTGGDLRRFGGLWDYLPPATNNAFLLVLYMVSGNWRNHQDRPVVLDLFCGAGGTAWGYWLAGYMVVGVDINPQPNYPFPFIQGDALEVARRIGHLFDLIHASPPCPRYSLLTKAQYRGNHPDLIEPTRNLLKLVARLYVIENVPGARKLLIDPVRLCGTSFGLDVQRHRYFEIGRYDALFLAPPCCHNRDIVYMSGTTGNSSSPPEFVRKEATAQEIRDAADIHWMIRRELDDAIPPAFTEYIGRQLYSTVTGIQEAA